MAQGGWWGLGTMGVALPYALIVKGPHQTTLIIASAAGVVMSVALGVAATVLGRPRRWRKPIMLTYTALHVVIVVVLAIADGGAGSPMALGFFGTFTFVAYTMPLRLLAPYGALNVIGYLIVVVTAGAGRPGYVPVELAGLLATGAACAHQRHGLLRQRRQLYEMARTDPLTGCLNRRGFDERLSMEFAAARADRRALGLLVIDLDDFKAVNDRRGHAAGDALLVSAAQTLRTLLGPEAPIGRLGGDEFAAAVSDVAPGKPLADLSTELEGHILASVGTAILNWDTHTPQALLAIADRALYQRKTLRKDLGRKDLGTRTARRWETPHTQVG